MKIQRLVLPAIILALSGCNAMYSGAMEKLGVHKREIMVDRVKEARDSQDGPLPGPIARIPFTKLYI